MAMILRENLSVGAKNLNPPAVALPGLFFYQTAFDRPAGKGCRGGHFRS